MRLNHLNLTVADVPKSRDFFATYFGFKCVVEKGRDAIAVMIDDSEFVLALSNFDKVAEVSYPGAFHIGFMQDSRAKVDEIFERLKADGFDPQSPREFHGAWTFYFQAPGGFTVEVGHQHRMG
jgi:lactoylglutathione lyase